MSYRSEKDAEYMVKSNQILSELPPITEEFIASLTNRLPATVYAYTVDIALFFRYLNEQPEFEDYPLKEMPLELICNLKTKDIQAFFNHYKTFEKEKKNRFGETYTEICTTSAATSNRRLATIRCFFKYLIMAGYTKDNPAALLNQFKDSDQRPGQNLLENKILNDEQRNEFISQVEKRDLYDIKTEKTMQKKYGYLAIRDKAIVSVFLGTGIRLSELIGLDNEPNSVNMYEKKLTIIRKGGVSDYVFFGDEVYDDLQAYITLRETLEKTGKIKAEAGNALFVSQQGKRINARTVEKIVKQYILKTKGANTDLHCHSLRTSFASKIAASGASPYVLKRALGHKSLETAAAYYVVTADKELKDVAEKVFSEEKN